MALSPRLIVRLPAPALRGQGTIGVNINANWLDPVRFVATSGNLATDFNTGDVYAGLTLAAGDTFLYQPTSGNTSTPGTTVGIYVVGAGAPVRRSDADTGAELQHAAVLVLAGTPGMGQTWININSTPPVVGTDNIIFRPIATSDVTQFAGTTGAVQVGSMSGQNVQQALGWEMKSTAGLTADESAAVALDTNHVVTRTVGSNTWLKRDFIPLSLFCSPSAAATANGAGFLAAAQIAGRLGVELLIDGGPGTTYNLTHSSASATAAYIVAYKDFAVSSDGATLFLNGTAEFGIFGFTAPTRASGLVLGVAAVWTDTSITLAAGAVAANGIQVGDVVCIDAAGVFPASTRNVFPYQKQTTRVVQSISGDTLSLAGAQLMWNFSTAEALVTVFTGRKISMNDVRIQCGSATQGRFDIQGFARGAIVNLNMSGPSSWSSGTGTFSVDGLQLYFCCHLQLSHTTVADFRYAISVSRGSYDIRITDIRAYRCRHPVDGVAWCHSCVVDGFFFNNCYNSIEHHAALACGYTNGIAYDVDPSTGMRGTGNWMKNVELYGIGGALSTGSATLMSYVAGYEYLYGATSPIGDLVYDAVIAPQTNFAASEADDIYIAGKSKFRSITVDGVASKVTRLNVGPEVETTAANNIRRIRQTQPGLAIDCQTTEATWSATASVTSISNANPAVVTLTAHGFGDQQRVTIAGVTGMTQANGTWTITWLSANTFSIPLDSTALSAAAGTITAARAGIIIRPDISSGIGAARGRFRARLRDVLYTLNARQASLVFPVRIYPDPDNTPQRPVRFGFIRAYAESRHDGLRIRQFGFHVMGTGAWTADTTGNSIVSLAGNVGATLEVGISNISGSYSATVDLSYIQCDVTVSGITSGGTGGLPVPIVELEIDTLGQTV